MLSKKHILVVSAEIPNARRCGPLLPDEAGLTTLGSSFLPCETAEIVVNLSFERVKTSHGP